MRLAHIAPPWIPVPPLTYGGTELMVDLLVRGLRRKNFDVLVFCAGDSRLPSRKPGRFQVFLAAGEIFGKSAFSLCLRFLRISLRPHSFAPGKCRGFCRLPEPVGPW
jgi:hypothetical protein